MNEIIERMKESDYSPEEYLWYDVMQGCGCGTSDDLMKTALSVFSNFANEDYELRFSVYEMENCEVIAHWMDSLGLIEHGSGIGGSWLTEKGQKIWDAFEDLTSQ